MNADREYFAAGYVIGGLSDDEFDQAETLYGSDAAFRDEVYSFRETMGLLTESDDIITPSAEVDTSILSIPRTISQQTEAGSASSETPASPEGARPSKSRASQLWALAASSLLVLAAVLGGVAISQQQDQSDLEESLASAEQEREHAQQLLSAPDLAAAHVDADTGGSVTVSYSVGEQLLYVTPHEVPPPGPEETLQMWIIDDEGAHDAGLMSADSPELVTDMTFGDDVSFGLTIEPEGGSPEPTSDPIVVAQL